MRSCLSFHVLHVRTAPVNLLSLRSLRVCFAFCVALLTQAAAGPVRGQDIAKYGAEFLAGGAGARAIGMGGAQVALAGDVTAGYWNAAGFSAMDYPEIAYMHVERFAGVVSFDYAAGAFPVSAETTVGLSLFRSGVNDIVNTLNAYNPETGQPRVGYQARLERFSAADYAFMLSVAKRLSSRLSAGGSGKIVRRTIGDFAGTWGYSLDLGVQYRTPRFRLGATLQDATTLFQSWSVNPGAFEIDCTKDDNSGEVFESCINPDTGEAYQTPEEKYEAFFSQELPEGRTELVLPVLRLGSGAALPVMDGGRLTLGLDVDVFFDGQQAYVANLGDVSFQPRLGAEFSYHDVVALRGGLNRILYGEGLGLDVTPSVGAGLTLNQVAIDFAFGDFAGVVSDLGHSYRLSVQLRLEQPGLKRAEE